ncbi:unnamed protein product [Caenorhabditis auriculariae]|uniref:Uncharacterized protein n=1 Tax=Caenorhabditis auriculariae TaxID=2777116 RepID=A0A8S1HT30_9PELO|nr:unnamed protein product [Caenorhabditis auriculariae]
MTTLDNSNRTCSGRFRAARGTPGVPILFACKLDTQSHAEAHSSGRSINCWQRDADKAMMGPPRKMPSRPSASRDLSSDKAERSSSAPPKRTSGMKIGNELAHWNISLLLAGTIDLMKMMKNPASSIKVATRSIMDPWTFDQLRGRLNNIRYQPNALKSS